MLDFQPFCEPVFLTPDGLEMEPRLGSDINNLSRNKLQKIQARVEHIKRKQRFSID